MAWYYFDVDDDGTSTRDEIGVDCPDHQSLRHAAIAVLPELARDRLPDGNDHAFSVRVRDSAGRYVFEARLSLSARWLP